LLKNAGVEKPTVFIQFAAQLAAWQAAATALPLPAFLEKLVVESHWLDQLLRHEEEAALRQVHTLLQAAVQLTHSNHNFRLADFVHHVALLREHNLPLLSQPWHSDEAAVRLMSAHRAKGLEFSHVFITRLNDRHWGNNRSGSRSLLPPGLVKYDYVLADSLEDERRLFYVALTRAKQGVVLTRAAHTATGTSTVPSRFVHELPSELIAVAAGSEEPLLDRVRTALVRPTPTADAKQYIQSLLQGYVMSVTHLNHYLECPRLFYVRDLLRLPMAPTRSLAVGAAVHESLRALFQELGDNGNVPKKSWVVARFVKALSRELLPEEEMKHAMARGRRIIGDYYDHYQQTLRPAALLEYNFAGHGVRIGNLPLTGKIDKVELLDAKQKLVNLVDYKTGRVEAGLKKLQPGGGLRRQLAFYHLLAQESPRFPYTIGSCEIDFVEPGPAGFTKKRVEIGQDEVEELRHSITRVWEEMKNLHFLRPEAGCGRATCVYCA
jgi:DNA helicase-2/ATP-dependent DNA helicase PcrA